MKKSNSTMRERNSLSRVLGPSAAAGAQVWNPSGGRNLGEQLLRKSLEGGCSIPRNSSFRRTGGACYSAEKWLIWIAVVLAKSTLDPTEQEGTIFRVMENPSNYFPSKNRKGLIGPVPRSNGRGCLSSRAPLNSGAITMGKGATQIIISYENYVDERTLVSGTKKSECRVLGVI